VIREILVQFASVGVERKTLSTVPNGIFKGACSLTSESKEEKRRRRSSGSLFERMKETLAVLRFGQYDTRFQLNAGSL
jgi:hypothetical protein